VGLRDRAVIGIMVYTFARVGAVVNMTVDDYYPEGKRWWLRLHEKGGKEMPAHHKLEAYLDEIWIPPRSVARAALPSSARRSARPAARCCLTVGLENEPPSSST
jgi:integrase